MPNLTNDDIDMIVIEDNLSVLIGERVLINDIQECGDDIYALYLKKPLVGFGDILDLHQHPKGVIIENMTNANKKASTLGKAR